MIWPFGNRYLEQQVAYWKAEATRQENLKLIYEKIAIQRCADLLGAQKVIRRLVAKVKRLKKGRTP